VVWRLSQDSVCLTCNREADRSIVLCQHQQLAPPGLQTSTCSSFTRNKPTPAAPAQACFLGRLKHASLDGPPRSPRMDCSPREPRRGGIARGIARRGEDAAVAPFLCLSLAAVRVPCVSVHDKNKNVRLGVLLADMHPRHSWPATHVTIVYPRKQWCAGAAEVADGWVRAFSSTDDRPAISRTSSLTCAI
jgi:hypothetical protein